MNHYNELQAPRTLNMLSLEELQTQLIMASRRKMDEPKRIRYINDLIAKLKKS